MRSVTSVDAEIARRWRWYFSSVNALHFERSDAVLRRLEAARRFLDTHLEDAVDLDAVARQAHFSKFHFLRLFKTRYHETPLRYLQRRRLEAAQRMLVRSDLPVTDICFRVGYESLGTFSSLFRRTAGTSPIAYRRRYVVVPRSIVPVERLIPGCWLRRYSTPIGISNGNQQLRNSEEAGPVLS